MRKLHFFSLILTVLFFSCSKDKEVTPSASLEGKYNLKSVYIKTVSEDLGIFEGGESEETIEFSNGSLTFGANQTLETDIAFVGIDDDEILAIVTPYTSEYSLKGNEVTLQIKDLESGKLIPLVLNISKNENNELQLNADKTALLATAKALDAIGGDTSNEALLTIFIKEMKLILSFTK